MVGCSFKTYFAAKQKPPSQRWDEGKNLRGATRLRTHDVCLTPVPSHRVRNNGRKPSGITPLARFFLPSEAHSSFRTPPPYTGRGLSADAKKRLLIFVIGLSDAIMDIIPDIFSLSSTSFFPGKPFPFRLTQPQIVGGQGGGVAGQPGLIVPLGGQRPAEGPLLPQRLRSQGEGQGGGKILFT